MIIYSVMTQDIFSFFLSFDWLGFLETYGGLSPLVPILITAAESFVPVLPLAGIAAWNMASYGILAGGFYSWAGCCLGSTLVFFFFRLFRKKGSSRTEKIREWVRGISPAGLFTLTVMPFTPSVLLNMCFGLSDYDPVIYLSVLYAGKVFLIFFLALMTHGFVLSLDEPLFLIPAILLAVLLWYVSRIVHRKSRLGEMEKDMKEEN